MTTSELSPEMTCLMREALAVVGWVPQEVEALLASGLLDDPSVSAQLEEELADSFLASVPVVPKWVTEQSLANLFADFRAKQQAFAEALAECLTEGDPRQGTPLPRRSLNDDVEKRQQEAHDAEQRLMAAVRAKLR